MPWRSRCAPSGTDARRFSPPKRRSSRASSRPRGFGNRRSTRRRARSRRRSSRLRPRPTPGSRSPKRKPRRSSGSRPPSREPAAGRRGGAGGILALRDTSGDGKADVQQTFGSEGGTGIALAKGALYLGTASTVYRYAMRAGSLAPLGAPDVIVKDLPVGGHSAKNLALAPDGRTLFVNIGSATNSCQVADRSNESRGEHPCPELAYRAGVWRFDATQHDQTRTSGTRFATGIRNAVGLAFAPSGGLYATQPR